MRIVVGGANGLIGRQLTQALLQRGDQVIALVRGKRALQGATVVEWDGRGDGPWQNALDGAEAVVNLAGAGIADHRWSDEFKRTIIESRTLPTRAIVQAIGAAAKKPRVLVNASAVGYYGGRGDELLGESAAPGNDFLAGACKAWEEEARKAPVRTVLLRTGVVLTQSGGALAKMVPPFKAFVGGPIGSGRQWMPWIHVADELAAILWAIDHEEIAGPLNLVSPAPVTMTEFARTLGQVLHRPSWAKVPAAALKVLVGEFASVLLEGQRAMPEALLKSGFVFRFARLRDALDDLFGDQRLSSDAAASRTPPESRTSTS